MKIVATYNIKGGVGKTASAVNLAYLAALEGFRTLVWDLDPQGATSFYFRIKPKVKGGARKLFRFRRSVDSAIKGSDFEQLDLLPADFSYRNLDLQLADAKKPAKQMRRLLRPLSRDYDMLFLDCPPSISLVSENVFVAADALLVPLIPTTLSMRTYDQLLEYLSAAKGKTPRVLPFFTMVDRRKRMHRELVDHPPSTHDGFLETRIPYASQVEQMGPERAPVCYFAPRSTAARAYDALWQEIKHGLNGAAG